MVYLQKDILLIGDTFVMNLHNKKNQKDDIKTKEDKANQFITGSGFDDSFFKALREDFQQSDLADTIENLLNDSVNPALLHLASMLERKRFSYDVVDCSLKHYEKLISFLKSTKYKTIGISTTFTINKKYIQDLIALIKQHAPESKIILGGMLLVKLYKLQQKEAFIKDLQLFNADYYIFNEIGEDALIDILNYELYSKPDIREIFNISYKTENGFEINSYKTNDIDTSVSDWTLSRGTIYAFMRASISCMFKCRFCDYPSIADKYKAKSIKIINEELKSISKAGIKYIRFLDDTFNIPKQHFHDILNELIDNNYNFKWVAYIRCQHLDEETVQIMKKSGCIGVFLGLESGNNDILKNMDKGATVEKYLEGVSFLHKYEIPAYGAFIIGFPGENDETIKDTINFIKQAKLQYYRLFLWYCNELAPIALDKAKYSIEVSPQGWKHSTMTSSEAIEKCKLIIKEVKTSIHCTIPFDYAFYLNENPSTSEPFNECLRLFNEESSSQF